MKHDMRPEIIRVEVSAPDSVKNEGTAPSHFEVVIPKDNLLNADPAAAILDVFVRTYNAADDPGRGLLEHQKRRFVYQRLRPLAQEAYEYLEAKYSRTGTQPTATASAQTQDVPDKGSVQHESEKSDVARIIDWLECRCDYAPPCGKCTYCVIAKTIPWFDSGPTRVSESESSTSSTLAEIRELWANGTTGRGRSAWADIHALLSIIDSPESVDCVCGHNGKYHREEENTGAARECIKCDCTQFSNVHMALKSAASNMKAAIRDELLPILEDVEGFIETEGGGDDALLNRIRAAKGKLQ